MLVQEQGQRQERFRDMNGVSRAQNCEGPVYVHHRTVPRISIPQLAGSTLVHGAFASAWDKRVDPVAPVKDRT